MPLLEVTQTKFVSASIRLTDATASQLNQYAHFIGASADEVMEEALKHVFAKDKDFAEFQKTPAAKQITGTLRVRKAPGNEAVEPPAMKPTNGSANGMHSSASVAGVKA